MQNLELPIVPEGSTVSEDVLVTYQKNGETITKRGFYDKSFGTFSVPPTWQKFNGVLLPHGWGGDHLKPENVVKWQPIKNSTIKNLPPC
jgi:hypothetical protein